MTRSKPSGGRARGGDLREMDRSLTIALLRAREATMARFRPLIAEHDLTEQQWRVLRALADGAAETLDATELAARSVIMTPSLTRILRTLEDRDLIERAKANGDGRRWEIGLTAQGRAVFDAIAPHSEAAYKTIERTVGREKLEQLLSLLDELSGLDDVKD